MNKTKIRFITIIATCFALFALLTGLAVGALMPSVDASAAAKTYSPTSLFWGMTGGEVRAYSLNKADAEAEDSFGYVTLVFAETDHKEGSVEYHRDLALKWYLPVNEKPEEGAEVDRGAKLQYFSMCFSFPEVNFDTFTVTFSGTEENVTKDGKSVNEIIFRNNGGSVYAYLKDSALQDDENKDYEPSEAERLNIASPEEDITIALSEEGCGAGEFAVTLNGQKFGGEHSKLTNVGGYFMEYSTSSNANVPLTFKAVMPEGAAGFQKAVMKEFNGQTMKVTGGKAGTENGDGTVLYESGTVTDDAPPALVLSQQVYAFTLGQRYSLDYEVMDVCDDTLSVTRYYYFARQNGGDGWVRPNLTEQQDKDNGYQQLYTNNYFLPTQETDPGEDTEYISIRFTIDDGRDGATDGLYYYLTWYASEGSVATLGEGENQFDYILVNRERQAPYYTVIKADEEKKENVKSEEYDAAVKEYQDQLNEAAKNASAGDGAYFYLPSLRNLIKSDWADYRNLRFSIYYYKPGVAEGSSASSQTSLRYNNLRFEIEEPGVYKFRIMAADAAGNTMQMYIDEGDGNMKLTALSSGNIWDVEELPDFTVKVGYKGAIIEPMEDQSIGYRGSSYNITNFEIIAYGNSTREYSLWYFDEAAAKDKGLAIPSYSEFVEDAAKFLNDTAYEGCFTEIRKYNSDVTADDEEAWNRTDNAYNWNPGSTPGSFTPQKSGIYIVKLNLIDSYLYKNETTAYQAIDIRNPVDITPNQIDWFRNNVTSVVLFSISAVLAVAIVVLLVVKPSEKNVDAVDLDSLKGKKKKNKNKE